MSQRYFTSGNASDLQNKQTQRFSPQNSRSTPFPRSSSEDNFVDFVPLDNSSPVQVGGRGSRWRIHNNMGSNSSFSPYSSNRNHKFVPHNRSFSFNKSQRFSPQKNRGGYHNHRGSNSDLRSWYDPSMVENPWAALEKKQEHQQRASVNNLKAGSDNKNSYSSSNSNSSILDDSWSPSVNPKDISDSPRRCDMTGINELSPSLSERSVNLSTPQFIALT